jgi:hypothetical protein
VDVLDVEVAQGFKNGFTAVETIFHGI